jgi:hypothetical protein
MIKWYLESEGFTKTKVKGHYDRRGKVRIWFDVKVEGLKFKVEAGEDPHEGFYSTTSDVGGKFFIGEGP